VATISVANFEAALGSVIDALTAENVDDAVKWLGIAETYFDGLSKSLSGDGFSKTRAPALDGARRAVERLVNRSTSGGLFEVHSRWVP
jgi:hypothetical protein